MEEDFQIMLSYRITEAGAEELGGDGTVPRMKDWLEAHGFTVFVGESSLQGGQDWARTIQHAVEKCEVFVAICSPDYGNTTWTYRELSMADNKKSTSIVPVWHSGRFPPSHVEIILGATQRVPSGQKSLTQLDDAEWEVAMKQLLAAFKIRNCIPKGAHQQFAHMTFEEHTPIWPTGEGVSDTPGSPKTLPGGAAGTPPLSWGLLTAMTAPLRQLLEAEGVRLEVAVQLSEEWGVTTVDDLALIDEEDVNKLGLKVIDAKRLKTVLNKVKNPAENAATTPRPGSAGLQRKYFGARQRRSSSSSYGLPVPNGVPLPSPAPSAKPPTGGPAAPPTAGRRASVVDPSPPSNAQLRRPTASPVVSSSGGTASPARIQPGRKGVEALASASVDASRRPAAIPAANGTASPARRRMSEMPAGGNYNRAPPGAPVPDSGGATNLPAAKRVTATVERFTLKGHTGAIASLAFSPDSIMLASGSSQYDRSIKIWSVQHGELRADLIGHGSAVCAVPFSPDNRLLASASKDKHIKLWDVSAIMAGGRNPGYSEKLSATSTLAGHTAECNGVAFTPDGKMLVSCSNDRSLKVWDVGTGVCSSTLTGHTSGVNTLAVSLCEARVAVSGGADGTVRVWDLRNGRCTRTLPGGLSGGVHSVALTVDGLHLLSSATGNKTIRVYDMRATGPSDSQALKGHSEGVTCVCAIPGLGTAASSSLDKTIRIWDMVSGTSIGTVQQHSATVSCVAAVSDGATLATLASGSGDETIKLSIVGMQST